MTDDLGRDLNEIFDKQQAELGNLAGTRERLMRDALAAHQQRTANRAQLAVGVAAAVIAALVIATFAYARAGTQPINGGPLRPNASPSPLIRPEGLWPRNANLAYDSTRAQVLVFGGDAPATNDTWAWDGKGWLRKSSAANPPALAGAAVTDDPNHHVVVLFGGDNVGYYYAETWLWNGSAWNQVFPAHSPSQRTGAAMTYDPVHHVVLLFGGHGATGDLNDTWVWDGTDWASKSAASSPSPRQYARLAFDAARGNAVLFGGFDGLNDTWIWDGTNWIQRHPAPTPPGLRQATPVPQQMVYDAARRVVVMVDSTQHAAELAQNTMDTWTWNGSTWKRLTPAASPNARDGFGLAYDERRSVTVLAGGSPLSDLDMVSTWTWDGVEWTGLGTHGPVATPSPAPRRSPASGLFVIDADPLDTSIGWVLLTNCLPPMAGKCHYSVASTADAGLNWSKPLQVGPSFNPTDGGALRSIRFINPSDGFVYGGTAAFATHDGGRTWGAVGVKATFFAQHAITGRGNNAWLLTYPCVKGTLCNYEVRSSVDGGRTWSSPSSLPSGFSPLDVIPVGDNGLLVSSVPLGDMELTLDGGATWNLIRTQCDVGTPRAMVASVDGNELWELCTSSQKFVPQKFFVSNDGGRSWSLHATSQLPPEQSLAPFSTILVSTKAGTAITASNLSTISITHDGGATWTKVGPDGVAFQSIGFANATEGWAVDSTKSIWSTSDGGEHWTVLQSPA